MARSVKKLTHFDRRGAVHMVDVGAKPSSHRVAVASGRILMQPATLRMIAAGTAKKGDVLGVARLAAIQAAKRTAGLIPLAHPLALSRVAVDFSDRKSTRLNSSHSQISYAVFCLKKKNTHTYVITERKTTSTVC